MSNGVDCRKLSLDLRGQLTSAESQLAALREELANRTDRVAELAQQRNDLQQRLADAERRNAELTKAVSDAEYRVDQGKVWSGMGWTYTGLHSHGQQKVLSILRAALNKPEEAKS